MPEDALPIAIEARELGKSAHKRLDGINGSIGRLDTKVENLDTKVDAKFELMDGKLNSILITLARADGGRDKSRGLIDNGKFLITAFLIVVTSSVGALIINWFLRRHG